MGFCSVCDFVLSNTLSWLQILQELTLCMFLKNNYVAVYLSFSWWKGINYQSYLLIWTQILSFAKFACILNVGHSKCTSSQVWFFVRLFQKYLTSFLSVWFSGICMGTRWHEVCCVTRSRKEHHTRTVSRPSLHPRKIPSWQPSHDAGSVCANALSLQTIRKRAMHPAV